MNRWGVLVAAAGVAVGVAVGVFLADQGLERASLWATVLGFPAVLAGIVMQAWPLVTTRRARGRRRSPSGRDHGVQDGQSGFWPGGYGRMLAAEYAPARLAGREEELNALTAFCAGPDACMWVQGPPWAGKTALIAWFALHPPAGFAVVSFFVNSRIASGADSDSFLRAMITQLAALCELPGQDEDSPAARRAQFLDLLQLAADKRAQRGERLVVLVDGLDEDQGSRPSIAYCLPRHLPEGVRVIVSGRMHPGLPSDVPGDHPLRWCARAEISPSPHALHVRHEAEHELRTLLADQESAVLIGFLTASGGGLAARDLAELTGRPQREVENQLTGAVGRSLALLPRGPEQVYVFAHATLKEIAEEKLVGEVQGYRAGIDRWYARYQAAGWPDHTPGYLLRPYAEMTARWQGPARLTPVVTDQGRHELMSRRAGGDGAALAELLWVQQHLCEAGSPSLEALIQVAIERTRVGDRNHAIPVALPEVLVLAGDAGQGEALAHAITDSSRQAEALARVATALIPADPARAERLAAVIPDAYLRAKTLITLAQGLAGTDPDRIGQVVTALPDEYRRSQALTAAAVALAPADPARARELASGIAQPHRRVRALAEIAAVIAAASPDEAMQIASMAPDAQEQALTLAAIAPALADADPARAAVIAAAIPDPSWRGMALADVALRLAGAGSDSAARLGMDAVGTAPLIGNRHTRAHVLATAAQAVAFSDPGAAERICGTIPVPAIADESLAAVAGVVGRTSPGRARDIASGISCPSRKAQAFTAIAGADVDAAGRAVLISEAVHFAAAISDGHMQAQALSALATAIARYDPGRARQTADLITDPARRETALIQVACAVAATDPAQAAKMVSQAGSGRAVMAAAVAKALAATSPDTAEQIAVKIPGAARRAEILAEVAAQVAAADPGRAARLAAHAARLTTSHSTWHPGPYTLTAAARAMADTDPNRAAQLAGCAIQAAHEIAGFSWSSLALDEVAAAIARTDPGQADQLATTLSETPLGSRAFAAVACTAARTHLQTAEQLAAKIDDGKQQAITLAVIAAAAAPTSPGRAAVSADRASQCAAGIQDRLQKDQALAEIARILAPTDLDRAEGLAAQIADDRRKAECSVTIAALAAPVHPERAEEIAARVSRSRWHEHALAQVAAAAPQLGVERVARIAERQQVSLIGYADSLAKIAVGLAATDHGWAVQLVAEAGRLAAPLSHPSIIRQPHVLAALACHYCLADPDAATMWAEAACHAASRYDPARRAGILAEITFIVTSRDPERMTGLQDQVRRAVRQIRESSQQAKVLSDFALLMARIDPGTAEHVADTIADPAVRAGTLAAITATITPSASSHAGAIAEKARLAAASIPDPSAQAKALLNVAHHLAPLGSPGRLPVIRAAAAIVSGECWPQAFSLLAIVDPAAAAVGCDALMAAIRQAR